MDKPDPTAVLTASHLEVLEDETLQALAEGATILEPAGLTMQQATDSATRIRYHEGQKARVQAEADAMIAPLLAQIDQIRAWAKEQTDDRDRRIAFHQSRLIAYAWLTNPGAKHVDIPGARIQAKQPDEKYDYGDEKVLVNTLRAAGWDAVVRTKHELDKVAFKKTAKVENGKAYLVNGETGEKLELPVTVTTPPVEYTVKLTEPKGA